MLIFWQIAAFVGIVALTVAWGNWVWDAHRPIDAPLTLGEVVVHGVQAENVDATARALALGVAGTVAEHYRTVDFINQASQTAGEFLFQARGPAPEPLLLQSTGDSERLDVTVEFAGARFDSKGLTALFQRQRPPRGGLSISVSLIKGATDNDWKASASASFPENSAYGFQTEAEGTLDAIARTIGLRFVQAHYSVSDPFFSAISGGDFTKLWDVRREAAEMALRGIGGDADDTEALRAEARSEYDRIVHLFKRYRRREDVQRLGAYLAQVADELDLARSHAEAARDAAGRAGDRQAISELLAGLKLEIENRNSETAAVTTPTTGTGDTLDDALDNLRVVNEPMLSALNIGQMTSRFPVKRTPRIGLVLGLPPQAWLARVDVLDVAGGAPPDTFLSEHAGRILSLFASIAPEAELVLHPVGSGQTGSGAVTFKEIEVALAALAAMDLDAIYLDFGVSARSFGKDDGAERWRASTVRNLEIMAGFQGLAVFAAGNDDVRVPNLVPPDGAPAFAIIGSTVADPKAPRYSNYGPGVDFVVPGEIMTIVDDVRLVQQRGTSMSAAIFGAAFARLAATTETPAGGAQLKRFIAETAVSIDDGLRPDFAEAADRLNSAADG